MFGARNRRLMAFQAVFLILIGALVFDVDWGSPVGMLMLTVSLILAGAAMSVGHASASAGEVPIELRGGTICDVTGFRVAIGHDAGRVKFLRAEPGPFLESHAGLALPASSCSVRTARIFFAIEPT